MLQWKNLESMKSILVDFYFMAIKKKINILQFISFSNEVIPFGHPNIKQLSLLLAFTTDIE